MVPGNHDVWPFGEEDVQRRIKPFLRSVVESIATGAAWPAQENHDRFLDTFAFALADTDAQDQGDALPCTKRVGPWLIGMLDTVSDETRSPAQGRFKRREGRWLRQRFASHESPRLLLMHHWPFAWSASNADEEVEEYIELMPWASAISQGWVRTR